MIYRAVLCCTFAVSLSIIHETQIPFTFFRDFLKKVFGALSVSQSSTAGVKPLSHGLRRDSSPSRGALGQAVAFSGSGASLLFALLTQRYFCLAADDALGAPAIRLKNESHAKASPTRGGGIERQR